MLSNYLPLIKLKDILLPITQLDFIIFIKDSGSS